LEYIYFKRAIVFGIIFLLFGAYVISSISGNIHNIKPLRIIKNINEVFENSPDIVYVDDDFNETTPGWGYDHFNKIKKGISAVADNGKVYVYIGTYNEVLYIYGKSIQLIGENTENTIIHSSELNNSIFNIQSSNVSIQGFTLTYFGGNPVTPSGILVWSDLKNISILNCKFENLAHGIVFWNASYLSISYSYFRNIQEQSIYGIIEPHVTGFNKNVCIDNCIINDSGRDLGWGYQSGGIYIDFCLNTEIINCSIYDNIGHGIYFCNSINSTINNNNIYSNSYYGILLHNDNENLKIHHNNIYNNKYYGIILEEGKYSNSNVHYNNISSNGNKSQKEDELVPNGGIWIDVITNGGLIIENNKIANNDEYGIILAYDCSGVKIKQNNFLNNKESDAYFRYYYQFFPKNKWYNNYWDRPRILPKIIFGHVYSKWLFLWFNIDWRPAIEPHDI
jgi:parallel beta-helix repeat protein